MKRKFALILTLSLTTALFAGCGNNAASSGTSSVRPASTSSTAESSAEASAPASSSAEPDPDQKAADTVAALIDAIYVQKRTAETDAQCLSAKAAWDALTDAQKKLVEGEFADPDYFGRNTGDASKDDPRNADNIGENELLVVSFGTSFNDSRAEDIGGIEKALEEAFPDWSVRRAFTSQIIINHIQARDGEFIDNIDQALKRALDNHVKNLLIQPTHLLHGAEYDELVSSVEAYMDRFESVKIAEPLLGRAETDASAISADKAIVANAVVSAAAEAAAFPSVEDADKAGAAFVFMGHGTSHSAKVAYHQMQAQMKAHGFHNVFIGTVEGEPEETSCEAVLEAVKEAGYKQVILRPLMVVAGDHANNDMAGEDADSWKNVFQSSGYFDTITCQIKGLGSIDNVQKLYIAHSMAATGVPEEEIRDTLYPEYKLASSTFDPAAFGTDESAREGTLADGVYSAEFRTDSSMFHVNEANEGKGVLTVKDGQMTIHVSLVSKKILNLYPGLAADAEKEGAVLLQPTTDTVTYSDGETEEVYGFDIPVPALDGEFDRALIGTSGKWYDHKVSVSNPVAQE